jgi:hypothetical protein
MENLNNNENLNQISSSLIETVHSYDTLKLFKTKSKLLSDELKVNDKVC